MTPVVPSRIARAAGAVSVVVGVLVLAGWAFGIPTLKSVVPGFIAMKANTAVAFVLLGMGTMLPAGRTRILLAGAAAALGAANLVEYAGLDLGIDQILFQEPAGAVRTTHPGRMAQGTAFAFLLLGIDAAALGTRWGTRANAWLAVPPIVVTMISLVGYVYGVGVLQGAAGYTPLGLHTAATLTLLAAGALLARQDQGLAKWVRAGTPGAVVVRRLLPVALVCPPLIGWLAMRGEAAGHYGPAFGDALEATVVAGSGAAMVLWAARAIDRAHAERVANAARMVQLVEQLRVETARSEEIAAERDRIFTLSLDLFAVAGTDGYFKRVNPQWTRTFGWPDGEHLQRPFMEFVHPDDVEATTQAAAGIAENREVVNFENRYQAADGSWRWLEWSARLDRPGGSTIYCIARDITGRKNAEAAMEDATRQLAERTIQAEAANRELESFSYSVSHDLRSPLRAVDGFSAMLLEDHGAALPEDAKKHLARIRAAAQRMGRLIDDLLGLAKVSRADLRRQRVDLSAVAGEIFAELRGQEPSRQVDVVVAPGLAADADRGLTRVLLTNLLGNAWKYTGKRATARIEFGQEMLPDGTRAFCVKDDGAGFDMAYANKLFVAFQRLHAAEDFQGTGIGLATVNRIVRRHGGRVWAEAAPGRGATFRFTLQGD